MAIKLGDRVKDKTSGFEGITFAIAQNLYGCDSILIKPTELKDGKPMSSIWFDVLEVEKIGEKVTREVLPEEGVG